MRKFDVTVRKSAKNGDTLYLNMRIIMIDPYLII